MLTYICSGDLPSETLYTATFLKKCDSAFNIFNSSSLLDAKPFKCALKESSPSYDFLKMMKSTFECLTVLGLKTQPPCMNGWVMTINALLCLWDELKSLPNVKYLCTRRINQDPLENCFSVVRSKGGFCDNQTPKQLTLQHTNKLSFNVAFLNQNCQTVNLMLTMYYWMYLVASCHKVVWVSSQPKRRTRN